MMNLLATVGATLPLLIGGGDSVPLFMAELGGSVVEQQSGQSFPSPVPVSIKLYSQGECVAGANVGLDGRYSITAPPGEYWAQILLGNQEAHAEKVNLTAGSWQKHFRVSSPVTSPTPPLVATGQTNDNAGIGGSGTTGQEDVSGFFGDAHRSGLLVPSLKPMPEWWEKYLTKPEPQLRPSVQGRRGGASRPERSSQQE